MGLPTVLYYRAKFENENLYKNTYHLTKNFLEEAEERFIPGTDILKDSREKTKIKLETLLETTDKFIKKHYKKHKLPDEKILSAREIIRKGLIKQSFFNKFVFNENESNQKWGLIEEGNHELRLAPLYSFDFCCGVEPIGKPHRRSVNGREDIQTFMLKYGKEKWFRNWIEEKVIPSQSIDDLAQKMKNETCMELTAEEKEYYEFMFHQLKGRVREVIDIGYYEKELSKRKRFANRMKDLRETASNKKAVSSVNSTPQQHGGR